MAAVLTASLSATPLTFLFVRCALAAIFTVAAVSKVMDRTGTQIAVAEFGVPERFAPVAAVAVMFTEIATESTTRSPTGGRPSLHSSRRAATRAWNWQPN